MEKYIIFENSVYNKKTEKKVYAYMLRRQLSLIKFLPFYILCNILRFFGIFNRKKYMEKRWSFLSSVNGLNIKLKDFFAKNKKKFFLPDSGLTVLSDAPAEVMSAFGLILGTKTLANEYDAAAKKFTDYKKAEDMIPDGEEYAAVGTALSPIMKKASQKTFVYSKIMFTTKVRCLAFAILHRVATYAFVLASAVVVGLASLYWASAAYVYSSDLFVSYFEMPLILVLNIAPVIVLFLFTYFLFNSAAASVFTSSFIVLLLTWVNHYKLMFRDDPFLVSDFETVMEAQNMTGHYEIVLGKKMILVIILAIAVTIFAAILLRCRAARSQVRLAAVIAIAVLSVWGVKNIYFSNTVYSRTFNPVIWSMWSSTQNFQGRGFIYPFIYSAKTAVEKAPDGYNKKEAESILSAYESEDIPEDRRVNVIGVMLEAFSDFGRFDCIEFTKDPYAKFRDICGESYSGSLVTDIFAGGTVRTERTFITGFNDLSAYRKPTNSYAWYFRDQGYTVEGGHPSYDWFYNRQNINPNLGFQNYYFDDDTYMALNGGYRTAPNSVLFPQITELFDDAMERGEDYFNFSVTYEGHGPYAEFQKFDEEYMPQNDFSDESYTLLNNYFLIVESVSESVSDMVETFRESDEPVVVVMFGDHMPWMGNNNSVYTELGINLDISTDEGFLNYYETPYFIWANDAAKEALDCDFTGDGPTVGSYFLMNELFDLAGYGGNDYLKFTSDIHKQFNVIHSTGICIDADGNICRELTEEQSETVKTYNNVQYYYCHNFAY